MRHVRPPGWDEASFLMTFRKCASASLSKGHGSRPVLGPRRGFLFSRPDNSGAGSARNPLYQSPLRTGPWLFARCLAQPTQSREPCITLQGASPEGKGL